MNEEEKMKESVMRVAVYLVPEIETDKRKQEELFLRIEKLKQPEIKNKVKADILYVWEYINR